MLLEPTSHEVKYGDHHNLEEVRNSRATGRSTEKKRGRSSKNLIQIYRPRPREMRAPTRKERSPAVRVARGGGRRGLREKQIRGCQERGKGY